MVYVDLRALHPMIHRMELFSGAKLIFVRMNDITSEYFYSRFSGDFLGQSFHNFTRRRTCASSLRKHEGVESVVLEVSNPPFKFEFFEFFVALVRVSYGFGAALR